MELRREGLGPDQVRFPLLNAGGLFADGLDMRARLTPLRYYPWEVKLYLIASSWDIIASERR